MFKVEFGKSETKRQREMERVRQQMALWDPTSTMESPRSTMTQLRPVDSSGRPLIIDDDGFLLTTADSDDVSRLTDDFKPRHAYELEKALNPQSENALLAPTTSQHVKRTSLDHVRRQGKRSKSRNAATRRGGTFTKAIEHKTQSQIEHAPHQVPSSPASPKAVMLSSPLGSSPSTRKTLDELFMAHVSLEQDLLASSTSGRLEPSSGRSKSTHDLHHHHHQLMSKTPTATSIPANSTNRMSEHMARNESTDHPTMLYSSHKSISNASRTSGQKSSVSSSASTLPMGTPQMFLENVSPAPPSGVSSHVNGHRGFENSLITFQRFVGEDVARETTLKACRNESMKDVVTRLQKSGSKVLRFSHDEADAIKKGERLISFSLSHLSKVKFSKQVFGEMSSSEVLDMSPIRPVVIEILVEDTEEGEDLSIF